MLGLANLARAEVPPPKPEDVKKMEAALPDKAPATPKTKHTVLVYGNAAGFVHSSIGLGEETIVKMGEKTGAYTAVVNNDPAVFDDLKDYDAIVLVSTTGHFLLPKAPAAPKGATKDELLKLQTPEALEKAKSYKEAEKQRMQNLLDFVQKDGKGLMGIHAATDAYYKDAPEYGELIGGSFTGHPWHHVAYQINDPQSPLTAMFKGKDFVIDDETYRFKENTKDPKAQPYSPEHVHELTSMDFEKSGVKDSDSRADHNNPISWVRLDGKGRVFYCSHGHSESVYANPVMLEHYLAGLQFVLGDLQADASPAK
jgi:type 1 glutamine amidotransferase